jgi:tetratricopeptide (TPR) repeat protein
MPDCPRCGHAEVTTPACPRCGVIVAKYRPPRPRTDRAPVQDGEESRPWWPFALLAAVVLAVGLVVVRPQGRTARGPAPSTVAAAPIDPAAGAPAFLMQDQASIAAEPPPAVDVAQVPEVPAADREKAEGLARRLMSPRSLTQTDLQGAEELLARFPEEKFMRNLVEALLLALAQQDRQRRQYASATARLQRAATVQPESMHPHQALMGVAVEAGDWAGAEAAARSVLGRDSRNVDAWRVLGYALLRQDRNREAAEALRTAQELREDSDTQALLDKIEKGLADEGGMRERQLAHFHVRYDGDEHEAVGREILRALERHYATLTTTLDHQPAAAVTVILFSRENYYNASGAPAWSGGVYDGIDGKIRIPIGGLTASLTPDMDGTLIHELTHAFVADRTRGTAPREIHEGLAQYLEGKRVDSMLTRDQMRYLADGRIGGVAGFYLAALSYVEYLMAVRGQGGINDLLRAMGDTGSVDDAFKQVHGGSMRSTKEAWAERLRRQYGS